MRGAHRALSNPVLVNRAFADVGPRRGIRGTFARAEFCGAFAGCRFSGIYPALVIGWVGPVFWPFAYQDIFGYTLRPYAADTFWPYAYDDVYAGLFGSYAYGEPPGRRGRPDRGRAHIAHICVEPSPGLTDWPIERIAQTVEPTEAQRARLDELQAATAKAVNILQSACPIDLPSTPVGRLEALEQRLGVMLQAVQTVRPALDRFYQSLNDEQKARFNGAPDGDQGERGSRVGSREQIDLQRMCRERVAGAGDLPFDRIEQAVRPTDAQRVFLGRLKAASAQAAETLQAGCPTNQALTPTGRIEAMEKRIVTTLEAVKSVRPALSAFYQSLNDEQKAGFNTLGSNASRPQG